MRGGKHLLMAAVSLLAACGEAPERVEVGQPAPAYGAVDLSGDSVHLSELRDRVVLLNVWATWCAPCREEIPALQALHEKYSDQGLEIVGVSIDGRNEREKLRPFADQYDVTYTLWHDPDDAIRTRYRVVGVPSTYLIDRDGVMVWRHMGPVTTDDPALNDALLTALANAGS